MVAHDWIPGHPERPGADGVAGHDRYTNRAVLYVRTRWGKIVAHEDFEDTERTAAYDRLLASETAGAPAPASASETAGAPASASASASGPSAGGRR